MTFVDVTIKRIGHIIEIEGTGASINFYPKNYDKTLNALVTKCKELQPDLASDKPEPEYLKRSVEIQLTEIYKEYQQEITSNRNKNNETTAEKVGAESILDENHDKDPIKKVKKPKPAFKYSNSGRGALHEAAIVAGAPVFLKYEPRLGVTFVEKIEESDRLIRPPSLDEYPYLPYEFRDMDEIRRYMDLAKRETIDSLYQKARSIVEKYNDQEEMNNTLIGADILLSHFQDLFPTIHYLDIVGDNETGKSSIGYTFEYTAYRPVRGTSISAANYYRVLGTIEPGQCTIIEDEADQIEDDPDKMKILKTGYEYNGKTPKINMNVVEQTQSWFFTYCLKLRIAEKSLDQEKARGLTDRAFRINCRPGSPQYFIKEIVSSPSTRDHIKKPLYQELLDFRKTMICYRLLHYTDTLPSIRTGLKNRDNELAKPFLQLFCGTESLAEIVNSLENFLIQKKYRKSSSLESILYPIIVNLVSQFGYELEFGYIWQGIKNNIEGDYDDKKPNQYQTLDYGILYKNTLTKTIVDKFCSPPGRKRNKNGVALVFDKEKISRFGRAYDNSVRIKVEAIPEEEGVGSVCNVISGRCVCTSIEIYPICKIQLYQKYALKPSNAYAKPTDEAIEKLMINSARDKTHTLEPTLLTLPASKTKESTKLDSHNLSIDGSNIQSIYRTHPNSDIFACKNCKNRGDIWWMRKHFCTGRKK
jgi:hypothetical protein